MDLIKANTIELTTGYYFFEVKDVAKYADSTFEPKIFISRVNDKVIKLYVQIFEHVRSKQRTYLRRMIAYNQNVDNQDDYFRHVQNNNNELAIPNSLVFLEKVVTAIQQVVEKQTGVKETGVKEAAINVIPNNGLGGTVPPSLSLRYDNNKQYEIYLWNYPDGGSFSIQNYAGARAKVTAASPTTAYANFSETDDLKGYSIVTCNAGPYTLTIRVNWIYV